MYGCRSLQGDLAWGALQCGARSPKRANALHPATVNKKKLLTMAITTKNIIVDDAETPNNLDARRLPDHQHVTRRHERSTKVAGPLLWLGIAGALAFGVAGLYFAYRFAEYIGNVNEQTSDLDVVLWAIVKAAATLATAGALVGAMLWVFSRAYRASVVRLPNDMPVSSFDVMNGYARAHVRDLVFGTMHAYYEVDREWARNSGLRNLNTLDLSTSTPRSQHTPVLDQPADDTPALPAFATNGNDGPLIAQLRRIGHIDRSGRSLLVGYAAQQPQYIEMESCGFIAIAGQARTGKTTTAEALIMQAALMGWEIIICDKHGRKETSLINRLQPAAHAISRLAIEIDDIISAIGYWHELGANRLVTENNAANEHTVLLVIDEFTGLILGNQLPPSTLAQLVMGAVEYPKAHAHGLIIGHQWNSRLLGNKLGANLRKATTHRLIHRIDPQDAEFLINSTYARKAQTVKTGNAIYFGGDSPIAEIAIPFVGAQDWQYVAQNVSRAPLAPAQPAPTVTPVTPVTGLETGNNPRHWGYEQRVRLARVLLGKRTGVKYMHSIRGVREITGLQTAKVIEISRSIGRSDTNE